MATQNSQIQFPSFQEPLPLPEEPVQLPDPISLDKVDENENENKAGGKKSARKTASTKKPKSSPVKTARSHKCKDGVVRKLYKKGENLFVKMKSKETGKFTYRKVKA